MFKLEEVKAFLKELGLDDSQENIKWAYEIMMKQVKLDIKLRKFELEWGNIEDQLDDDCCGDDCCCSSNKKDKSSKK